MRFRFALTLSILLTTSAYAQTALQNGQIPPVKTEPTHREAPVTAFTPPDTAANTAALLKSNGGSLLRASLAAQTDPSLAKASQISFFAVPPPQPRVLKKHDLITIVVDEESQYKSAGDSDLEREADIDAKVTQFVRLSLSNFGLAPAIGSGPVPEVNMTGTRNSKDTATVDRSDSLTLRVQAEVIDVKPNNTMVLQARASITTDEEVQTLVLSGTCRSEDVTPDNTVLSTQLFDKSVTKTHTGAVRDTTKRGWVPRLLDVVNPF